MKHLHKFHRFQKFMAAVMVFAMLFGSVPAWAVEITIDNDGNPNPETYSSAGSRKGVDAGGEDRVLDGVTKIYTTGTTGSSGDYTYGIFAGNTYSVTEINGNITGGIHLNSTETVVGIYGEDTAHITLENLGGIMTNNTSPWGYSAYGIQSCGSGAGFETNVSFSGTDSYINAMALGGDDGSATGIAACYTGKTYVKNLGGIMADARYFAYGIFSKGEDADADFENNVSFVTTGGYINATSASNSAYGIYACNTGTTTVTNIHGIEANGSSDTFGIFSQGEDTGFETNVSFVSGGYINATSKSNRANGIYAGGQGKATVSGLKGIEANGSTAYGIFTRASEDDDFEANVSFVTTGGYINATATSNLGEAKGIHTEGKTTVSGLKGIEANGSTAYGIYSISFEGFENSVSFVEGGYINATATGDFANAQGICTENYDGAKTTVSGLKGIEANGSATAYGIHSYFEGSGEDIVGFSGDGSYIKATAAGADGQAAGIYTEGVGTTIVTNLGGIEVTGGGNMCVAPPDAKMQIGIRSEGKETNVSFVTTGGYINVSATRPKVTGEAPEGGGAIGIYAAGKTYVRNVRGIEANATIMAMGISSYGQDAGFEANISFVSGGYINATSGGNVTGISAGGKGTMTVSGLKGIMVNGSTDAYGIVSSGEENAFRNIVSFSGTDSYIKVTSTNMNAYGIGAQVNGTTTVTGLKGIEANGMSRTYGIYSSIMDDAGENNVSFAEGGYINATDAGDAAYGIYGDRKGKTTVTGLRGITADGVGYAAGVQSGNGFEVNVSFGSGSYINATATWDESQANGIFTYARGKTYVTNLGGIEVKGKSSGIGIFSDGNDAGVEANVSFAAGGYINATGENGTAYGIHANGTGTTTVSNLVNIKANGSTNVYGIYSNGSNVDFKNNVSFATTGGYINAAAAGENGQAMGIHTEGKGKTTVTNLRGIEVTGGGNMFEDPDAKMQAGIYSYCTTGGNETNVSFVAAGGYINVSATCASSHTEPFAGGSANGIYAEGYGKTTVTNLRSIEVNGTEEANGIQSHGEVGFEANVSFVEGGYINATSANGNACGIKATYINKTTVSGLQGIMVNGSTGANGIYNEVNSGNKTTVNFANGGYINATTTGDSGETYGIYGASQSGYTIVTGLHGITANAKNCAVGIVSCRSDNTQVSFAEGGYINATAATSGDSRACGIYTEQWGNASITNLSGIEATAASAYGIYSSSEEEWSGVKNNVSFAEGGYVNATGTDCAYGIYAQGKGKTYVTNLSSIKAKSGEVSYGIYSVGGSEDGFENNVSFVSGGYIDAISDGNAYGIYAQGIGTTTVSNLGSIEAKGKGEALGIYSISSSGIINNISFVSGSYINATVNEGSLAVGIYARDAGITTISGLKGIRAYASCASTDAITASGISSSGYEDFENNVSFSGADSYINVTADGTNGSAYGIKAQSKGTTTVTNLGGITANGNAAAYGIYSCGSGALTANISFKGNGGQAITATAADAANAYSIYAEGQGATTVNFEDSILSGKIKQQGDAVLTLNFNNGGVWTPANGDVSGNVTVNANNGGTVKVTDSYSGGNIGVNVTNGGIIDTLAATTAAKIIDLGTGIFAAAAGSTISFDAETTDDALNTDQIKAASATGTIALGSVNVNDTATAYWTEAKEATVFDTTTPAAIAITGETTTMIDGGHTYKFTGLANGKVKAEVLGAPVVTYTLPQVIQATPQEAGVADTFSMTENITLDADLGTLNNAYRSSGRREFTLNGNGKTLAANGKGGVTINSGDTMTVTNTTVKDFAQFAANAGTLKLDGVTFTGTTGDAVTGEGVTEITGGATKLGDAGITQKSITIANSAELSAKADKLLATDGIANNGQLILTDGDLVSHVSGSGTTTFKGTTTLTDSIENNLLSDGESALLTLLDSAVITGNVTADNNSNIYVWQNAASSSIYTAKNYGTIHFMGGTLTAKGGKSIGDLFGTEHGQTGGKFILEADGVLDTQANQLFSVEDWSSLTTDAQKIDYSGGSVKIADDYTLDKVSAANEALKNASSAETSSSFVVTGDLITEIGGQEYKNVTTVESIDDPILENTVFDKVTAVALNGSMFVGTKSLDAKKILILKEKTGIDIKDTTETSINIDKLVLQGQEATGVVISNGLSVTVGGFSGRNAQTASEVIVNEISNVDVIVGLDKATADAIELNEKRGDFTIGNGAEDANTKYQLTGNVTVNEDSTLNVASKSETTITKDLNLKGAIVTVNDESVLNVEGEVTVAKDTKNFIEGSIKGEKLVNDGTLTASASDLGFKTIQNNSMHTLNLTDGEIQAEEITSDGEGSVVIAGDVTATGQRMTNQVVTVTAGNSLTFTGKTTTLTGGQLKPEEGSTLAFNLDSFKDKDTIVSAKASGKVNLLGKDKVNVKLLQEKSGERFTKAGQYVTLIDNVENYGYSQENPNNIQVTPDLVHYKYAVYEEANELLAGYLDAQAMEETKSLSEGRLAGAVTLTQANDLMADAGITQAVSAANLNGANGATAFASIQGAHGRYHTGSYVDLNSFNVAAGLAKKLKNDATTIGLFIEGGNGRYASYNDFTDGEVRADGDINYFGGGVFARHNFKQTDKGNTYVDATFGAGHTNQDYATESMALEGARYDAGAAYLKAHATFGYEWKLAKGAKVDSYLKYLYTRQNGSDVTTNTEVPVSFDTINSHRLRIGARYTQDIKKTVSWYGGLAYEYEFDMEASADIRTIAIAKPDLKGASGMAEVGIKFNPATAKDWKFDLGVQGFTGKRDSLGVRLGAWYEF